MVSSTQGGTELSTVLVILGLFAAGGFLLTIFGGGNAKDAAAGAAGGAFYGLGCIVQLMIMVIPIVLGLWLWQVIFG